MRSPQRATRRDGGHLAAEGEPGQTNGQHGWGGSPPASPLTRTRPSPRDTATSAALTRPVTPTSSSRQRKASKAWPQRGWIGAGRDRSDSVVSHTTSDMDDPPSPARSETSEDVVWTVWGVVVEIVSFWLGWLSGWLLPTWMVRASDNRALYMSSTYAEWRLKAAEIDRKNGAQRWKMAFESPDYDYVLLHERLKELQKARHRSDWARSAFMLRALDRNIGGIGSPKLFEPCILGTKELVEQYLNEVRPWRSVRARAPPHVWKRVSPAGLR